MISAPVFARMLRDRRRGFIGWSVGMAAQTAFIASVFPTIKGQDQLDEMMNRLPDNLQSMFGLDTSLSLSSALGYLDSRTFSTLVPVLLIIYAIGIGSRAIAGAEDDGLMELPASYPITRRALAGARLAAMAVLVLGLSAVAIASIIVIGPTVDLLDGVSPTRLVAAGLAAFLLALTHGTLAFTLGAGGSRRAMAIGVPAGLAVGGWLAEGGGDSTVVAFIRWLTPWHWYIDARTLVYGLTWQAAVLPIVTIAVLTAVGIRMFGKRDLR